MRKLGIFFLFIFIFLILIVPARAWYSSPLNLGPGNDTSHCLAVADLDKDGFTDIVVGNFGGQNMIYFGDGDGTFDTRTVPIGPGNDLTQAVALFDANNDTWIDIAVGNQQQQSILYVNDGDGTFDTISYVFGTGSDYTFALAYGDVNGDTLLDLAAGNNGQENYLYINDGSGNPYDTTAYVFGLPGPNYDDTWDLAFADMNNDTLLDLVSVNHQQQNFVYLNDGSGNPYDTVSIPFGVETQFHHALAVGDLNGDNFMDVVEGNYNGQNRAYLGNGTGALTESFNFGLTGNDKTHGVVLADIDGDTLLDVVFANGGDESQLNHTYLGNGTGTFGSMRTLAQRDISWDVKCSDFNGDSLVDIAIANVGQNYIYLNLDIGADDVAALFSTNTIFVAGDDAYCTDVLGSSKIAFGLARGGALENPEGRTELILTPAEHDTGNLIIVGGPAVNPIATEFDGYFGITYINNPPVSFEIIAEGQNIFLDLTQHPDEDICIVYIGVHNNRNVMIIWGYGWWGTYAGSAFIADTNNWVTYQGYHMFMLRWNDTNSDGLVQMSEITVERMT